jgi:hypothetical protein
MRELPNTTNHVPGMSQDLSKRSNNTSASVKKKSLHFTDSDVTLSDTL